MQAKPGKSSDETIEERARAIMEGQRRVHAGDSLQLDYRCSARRLVGEGSDTVEFESGSVRVTVGAGEVLPQLDAALLGLRVGEQARVRVAAEALPWVATHGISQESEVVVEAVIRSVVVDDRAPALSSEQNLERALKAKAEGNELFKSCSYSGAIRRYRSALRYLCKVHVDDLGTDEATRAAARRAAVVRVLLPANLNIAAAALQLSDDHLAVRSASRALRIDESNVKALYRRGQAHARLRAFGEAKADLSLACKLDPKNAAARRELDRVRKQTVRAAQKEKAAFADAFG